MTQSGAHDQSCIVWMSLDAHFVDGGNGKKAGERTGKVRDVWTHPESRWWIYWTKDAEQLTDIRRGEEEIHG